jgi:hypothetical protein
MLQNGDADAQLKRIFLCNNLIAKKRNISVEEAYEWYMHNFNGLSTDDPLAAQISEKCANKHDTIVSYDAFSEAERMSLTEVL